MYSAAKVLNFCRANWRIALLFSIPLYVVGYPVYIYLDSVITGGISRHGDLISVDLKSMSNFDLDPADGSTDDIPKKFRDLDGQRVMLAGEMWAPSSATARVDSFQLCYSITKCCFTGPPKVQHFVQATVPGHQDARYFEGLVNVTGILHVGVKKVEGKIQSVYRIEVERIDPA